MKTYSSYVNFLCSLMAIDIPDICYSFKEQYYDVNGFDIEPFEMESHCKSRLIPDENRIYINLNEMHGEYDIYFILAHEIRHCAQYQATEGIGLADIAMPETIYEWKIEFSRYNPGCNDESCQEVELDAMAFTWFVGKVLLNIDVDLSCDEVITHFADILDAQKRLCNKDLFIRDVYKREEEMSTSMGLGVAIPHTQSNSVKDSSLVFIKLKKPINWNTDNNVQLIFGIAVPKGEKQNEHLKILSGLARKLMNDDFRDQLTHVEDKEDCLKILKVIE